MTDPSQTEIPNGDARETVGHYGRKMLSQGLTKGTGGNVSSRTDDGLVAISPSGMPYEGIDPEDVPVIDLDGKQRYGDEDPSAEHAMHTMVYDARDDVGGIVHTHSPYASTFASLREPILASHYLIAFAGDKIPVAEYVTYGTEALGQTAVDALGEAYDACLLANHGVLAVGSSLGGALETAQMVEYCARIHYQARAIGEPVVLPDEEVDRLQSKFKGYGQNR